MTGWKCLIDMDGVLDDFVGACCRVHEKTCYDKQEHYGHFDMEKLWGISLAEFWAPTNSYMFWRNLEKTPEADAIVDMAVRQFGLNNIAVLTSPSLYPLCVSAKRDWMQEHFPFLVKNMIFAWGKGFIGGPKKVLIDDRDRNVDDFEAAGGEGILVPRLWNRYHEYANEPFKTIKNQLEIIDLLEAKNNATNGS